MAKDTPTAAFNPRARKVSDVAPDLPVVSRDDLKGKAFYIIGAELRIGPSKFDRRPDAETWRLECQAADSAAKFLQLFAGNAVRNQQFQDFRDAFAESPDPIGPCRLHKVKLDGGNDAFNVVDADSPLADW